MSSSTDGRRAVRRWRRTAGSATSYDYGAQWRFDPNWRCRVKAGSAIYKRWRTWLKQASAPGHRDASGRRGSCASGHLNAPAAAIHKHPNSAASFRRRQAWAGCHIVEIHRQRVDLIVIVSIWKPYDFLDPVRSPIRRYRQMNSSAADRSEMLPKSLRFRFRRDHAPHVKAKALFSLGNQRRSTSRLLKNLVLERFS
jgi:hypothetical protein